MSTVTVRQRGEITLPKAVRDACHLAPGTALGVIPIGDVIVLIKGDSHVGEAAAQLEHLREAAGLTIKQMLEGLDEERERYYREHYSDVENPIPKATRRAECTESSRAWTCSSRLSDDNESTDDASSNRRCSRWTTDSQAQSVNKVR